MAGIGFTLQKFARKDDLLGIAKAYTHAAFAAVGPWLFTVLALGGITLLFPNYYNMEPLAITQLENFRAIVIYNFCFSLVMSAPIFMVVNRYLADAIHKHDVTQGPSVLLLSLIMILFIELPIGALFYFGYVELPFLLQLSAVVNLFLVSIIWLLAVFLTSLKDYNAVTRAFLIGMIIAVIGAQALRDPFGDTGMLTGFSIGLTYIAFALFSKIMAEYPYRLSSTNGFRNYFSKYWELALGGFFYNAGIWVDKWIMWFAPERLKLPSNMIMYPDYDSAMFLAYLTIVPAIAMFMFSIETNFFLHYKKFYYDILEHRPLSRIRENQKAIINSILGSTRNFLVVQGTICFVCILMAAKILEVLNVNYMQIGMFRLGTLGALFHVLMLFGLIILSYFDCRKLALAIYALFFAANTLFTLMSMHAGFPYYGYGYFAACVMGFLVTAVVLFTHIRKLPYHAFITHNNSLKKAFEETQDEA